MDKFVIKKHCRPQDSFFFNLKFIFLLTLLEKILEPPLGLRLYFLFASSLNLSNQEMQKLLARRFTRLTYKFLTRFPIFLSVFSNSSFGQQISCFKLYFYCIRYCQVVISSRREMSDPSHNLQLIHVEQFCFVLFFFCFFFSFM